MKSTLRRQYEIIRSWPLIERQTAIIQLRASGSQHDHQLAFALTHLIWG